MSKPDLTLLPWSSVEEVARAFASKNGREYEPDDWRDRKTRRDHIAAALRHISAEMQGQEHDIDTTLRHLAHAAARLLMALDPCYENRPEPSPVYRTESLPSPAPELEPSRHTTP